MQTLGPIFLNLLLLPKDLSPAILRLLIVQIKGVIDELSEGHVFVILHYACFGLCTVNLEHFGNEAADVVVGQDIELVWRENISQEAEDLEEDELILNGALIVYFLLGVGVLVAQA